MSSLPAMYTKNLLKHAAIWWDIFQSTCQNAASFFCYSLFFYPYRYHPLCVFPDAAFLFQCGVRLHDYFPPHKLHKVFAASIFPHNSCQ